MKKVATNTIDAGLLAKMFLAGAKNLEVKKEWINELNVFPVPDGDTGTNMTLTIMSAVKEVNSLTEVNMYNLSKAISSGSLRGARGNSGVILSQLLRGFTKKIRDYEELNAEILAEAMEKAVETAYKAVMKPKEGTILTVAKGAAEKAAELAPESEDLNAFIEDVLAHAEYVLSQTPEMLPVLKEAGVVDSGGQGLLTVQGDYIRIDYDFSQACIHTTFHALYPPIPSYYSKHMETGITDSTLRYIITAFPQKRKFKMKNLQNSYNFFIFYLQNRYRSVRMTYVVSLKCVLTQVRMSRRCNHGKVCNL